MNRALKPLINLSIEGTKLYESNKKSCLVSTLVSTKYITFETNHLLALPLYNLSIILLL